MTTPLSNQTMINPGTIIIHCYTYLAHPRFECLPVPSYILDAALPAMPFSQQCQFITCSLCFRDYNNISFHRPAIYLIEANVYLSSNQLFDDINNSVRLQNLFQTYISKVPPYLTICFLSLGIYSLSVLHVFA